MKTLVTIIAASVLAGSAFAQGLLNWNTAAITGSTIKYSVDPAFGTSAGQTYDGTKGNPLSCGIWVGPAGASENQLAVIPSSVVTVGTGGPSKGNVVGMTAFALPAPYTYGQIVTLQIRAWDGVGFSLGTVVGRSGVTQLALGGPAPTPAAATWSLTGVAPATTAIGAAPTGSGTLAGFTLVQVPEPTVAAIAGLGLASMLILRRKKA